MFELNNKRILFNSYIVLIFGCMPMVVTPWRREVFYDGKIAFVALVTFIFATVLLDWIPTKEKSTKENKCFDFGDAWFGNPVYTTIF